MPQSYAFLGTVSHGTARTIDLVRAFSSTLGDLIGEGPGFAEHETLLGTCTDWLLSESDGSPFWDDEDASGWMVQDLTDALNEYAPPFCYFGANEGDGSDYGFWLDSSALESAVQDGECIRVSDSSEIPEGYEGLVALVSDHGNVTLLNRTARVVYDDEELWSVV